MARVDSRDVQIAERISQVMGWEYEYFPLPEDWGRQRLEWLPRAVEQTDCELDVLKMSRTIREQTLKAKQMNVSCGVTAGKSIVVSTGSRNSYVPGLHHR